MITSQFYCIRDRSVASLSLAGPDFDTPVKVGIPNPRAVLDEKMAQWTTIVRWTM